VLDLGCGYGDFINNVRAPVRVGVDTRDCDAHLASGVTFVHAAAVEALAEMPDSAYDLIMASNLLEHLDWDEVGTLLDHASRALRPGGRLMLLQPNFAYSARQYFDDYTHRTIFTDESLAGWVQAAGLEPVVIRPRYLPFTMNSRLPACYALTKLYLALGSPVLGAQMLVVAERR
jgi:ubiquinone/menaquinone biosynthesis C-methylase UbiE